MDKRIKVCVYGAGRWGTFLAWYLSSLGHAVTLYGRAGGNIEELLLTRKNEYVELGKGITLTSDLKAAADCDIRLAAISAQNLRAFLNELKAYNSLSPLVLCMKGLEDVTALRLTEVAAQCGFSSTAVWLGPGHIQNFTAGIPNCMVIDSADTALKTRVADNFGSDLIRFYYGGDLIGNELGAAAKNVVGIAAGMLDGLGYSSLKGPLMARGAREISRLIRLAGGSELTAYGLCHLGDYETTLFSPYSNNRTYGIALAKGQQFEKLAEGAATASALMTLAKKLGADLPITEAVRSVIYDKADINETLLKLFSRSIKQEF